MVLLPSEDKSVEWRPKTEAALDHLAPLIERDAKQVREGLPQGAAKLGELLDADPGSNPEGLRRAIKNARAAVKDLAFAKSTFFMFVDREGTVLRSEADPDLPAGKSLVKAIPEMKKALDPKAGLVSVVGKMHELRGAEQGNDMQWVVGHPVVDADGQLKGAFVTGWSFRGYAYYLEQETRPHFIKIAADKAKVPLVYVFVLRGQEAFGAPITPQINAETLGKMNIPAKLSAGVFFETVKVEDHPFMVVAKPFPALGEGMAVAMMVSLM